MRAVLFLFAAVLAGCASEQPAQPTDPVSVVIETGIQESRIDREEFEFMGSLFITVGDEERVVDDEAISFWIAEDGKAVYWSFPHYKSGFEAEGQGLKRYRIDGEETDIVFEDDLIIESVIETVSISGRVVLLFTMVDGGLGGPTVAVVDPDRGRVFREPFAKIVLHGSGKITVETYDVQAIAELDGNGTPEPLSTREYDLDELLERVADRDVIYPWLDER